jgi:transcriptional regulator with XRE-family HTH domain
MSESCSIGVRSSSTLCAQKARGVFDNCRMPKAHSKQKGEYQDFADRLEQAMARILPLRDKPYSIQEKADAMGFSKSFMADMLRGDKMPSAANIMDIAVRTGVKAEWLWTARGPMVEKITEGGYLYVGDLKKDEQEAIAMVLRSYKKRK